eukprot:gene23442-33783_t
MGSVGVWWGVILSGLFVASTVGSTVAAIGPKGLSRGFWIATWFRTLHGGDVMTDTAAVSVVGVSTSIGKAYGVFAVANLLLFVASLATTVQRTSVPRVSTHLLKCLAIDVPMFVFDIFGGAVHAGIELWAAIGKQRQMENSVEMAERVSAALVRFDLD